MSCTMILHKTAFRILGRDINLSKLSEFLFITRANICQWGLKNNVSPLNQEDFSDPISINSDILFKNKN